MDTIQENAELVNVLKRFFNPKPDMYRTEIINSDGSKSYSDCINNLREDTFAGIMEEFRKLGLILSGGAITSIFSGQPINDLDFYLKYGDKANLDAAIAFLSKWFNHEKPYITDNAYTFKRKSDKSRKMYQVQLITRFKGNAEKIHENFDFTITQGSYDFEFGSFILGPRFLADIGKRKLVFCGKSLFPICALYRTKKYGERGYKVPGSTLMHIALSIVRLEIKTYKQLKEQLHGVDTAYLQDLLNSEKYDDALPVDYAMFLEDAFATMLDLDAAEELQ